MDNEQMMAIILAELASLRASLAEAVAQIALLRVDVLTDLDTAGVKRRREGTRDVLTDLDTAGVKRRREGTRDVKPVRRHDAHESNRTQPVGDLFDEWSPNNTAARYRIRRSGRRDDLVELRDRIEDVRGGGPVGVGLRQLPGAQPAVPLNRAEVLSELDVLLGSSDGVAESGPTTTPRKVSAETARKARELLKDLADDSGE